MSVITLSMLHQTNDYGITKMFLTETCCTFYPIYCTPKRSCKSNFTIMRCLESTWKTVQTRSKSFTSGFYKCNGAFFLNNITLYIVKLRLVLRVLAYFSYQVAFFAFFKQCKHGHYFAWADSDPGIKLPV